MPAHVSEGRVVEDHRGVVDAVAANTDDAPIGGRGKPADHQ
eukprot:gene20207-42826_t